ncbi:MAG: hypothetical protein WC297_00270 [Candidatus Paceibacterota bacterium]|jgi:hypothetical protein
MLKRLKLASKIPPYPLIAKTLLIFLLLILANFHQSSFWAISAFIFFAVLFYFWPLLNSSDWLGYFLIFLTGSLITILSLDFSVIALIAILGLTIIFFLLIGSKNLNLSGPQSIFLLRSFLFLLIFFMFFSVNKAELFWLKYLALIAAIFIIFFGLLKNYPKKKLYTVALTFLLVQIVWAIGLLPIGFINQTALTLVFILIVEELIVCHFSGAFNYQNIVKNVMIVVVLMVLILALSKWTI